MWCTGMRAAVVTALCLALVTDADTDFYSRVFPAAESRSKRSGLDLSALSLANLSSLPFPWPYSLNLNQKEITSLPILVLPLPVLVQGPARSECDAHGGHGSARPQNNVRLNAGAPPTTDPVYSFDTRSGLPPLADQYPTLAVTSDQMVEQFLAQRPTAPHLPPAVIPPPPQSKYLFPPFQSEPSGFSPQAPRYLPPSSRSQSASPVPPRFKRSLMMRATLTVDGADYTEPYMVMWDANTGSSRMEFHGGTTAAIRTMLPDGRVQRVEMRLDRSGDVDVRRCGVAGPAPAAAEDRALPGIPDLERFSFAGYREGAEMWRFEQTGRMGELGAARGERLTYRHEMMMRRESDDTVVPMRYKVSIDSSVLGASCDGYEHRYEEVREQEHDSATFAVDLGGECDAREQLNPSEPEHMARLEPLREFTMMRRDPRYDEGLDRFKREFTRDYIDEKEEAVRKNLFTQHSRFVHSCNREGATFEVHVNFLFDRLDAELEVLLGTVFSDEVADKGDSFPLAGERLRSLQKKLPKEFDWRPRGAVTHVRYQESCSSCWAFAVVGSVEGALFVRTRQLVPLSEQCLVDCAHSHGANGCKGTWPSHAYDYTRDRGLPKLEEYPYKAKVERCRAPPVEPVTHISGFVNVPPNDTDALKVAIRRFAPNVVVVDSRCKSFLFYKKGVLHDDRCVKGPKQKLNHAVLAVGWGERNGEPHFIIKNSYSAGWADGGYIRLHAPSNTCGVLTFPSFARLRLKDVDRPPAAAPAPPAPASDDGIDYADDSER